MIRRMRWLLILSLQIAPMAANIYLEFLWQHSNKSSGLELNPSLVRRATSLHEFTIFSKHSVNSALLLTPLPITNKSGFISSNLALTAGIFCANSSCLNKKGVIWNPALSPSATWAWIDLRSSSLVNHGSTLLASWAGISARPTRSTVLKAAILHMSGNSGRWSVVVKNAEGITGNGSEVGFGALKFWVRSLCFGITVVTFTCRLRNVLYTASPARTQRIIRWAQHSPYGFVAGFNVLHRNTAFAAPSTDAPYTAHCFSSGLTIASILWPMHTEPFL